MASARRWAGGIAQHPRHVVLGALVAGLLLGPRVPAAPWWVAALLAAGSAAAAAHSADNLRRAAVALALAALAIPCGAWIAAARLHSLARTALRPWPGHALDVRATLLQPPRARTFGRTVALARIAAGVGENERVLVETEGALSGDPGEEL